MSASPFPSVPPIRGGKTIAMGVVLVGGLFSAFYANMQRRQTKKDEMDPLVPGTVPTWSHRLMQARHPADGNSSNARAFQIPGRSTPVAPPMRDHINQHSTIQAYLASPGASEEGRRQHPTPQRGSSNGSGLVYTKSPEFGRGYEKLRSIERL